MFEELTEGLSGIGAAAGEAVQQAQQPFKGENPADEQWAGFRDHQVGQFPVVLETDREVGKHQAQKADAAFDCPGQRWRGNDGATEELEGAGA